MDGKLADRPETMRRQGGGPSIRASSPRSRARPGLAHTFAVAVAVLLLGPGTAAAQQDTARAEPTADRDTIAAAQDTLPPDSLAAGAAQDTLTPRERALQRLRALPRSPVQPDTTDSAAVDSLAADSLSADSLGADSLSADSAGAPSVPPGLPPGAAGEGADSAGQAADTAAADSARLRPQPPDTVGVPWPAGAVPIAGDSVPGAARENDPPAMRAEAVREQLLALEGYVRTEYQGAGAVFFADSNQLEITGDSRLAREGSTLETDSLLVYDGEAGVVCGYGMPVLSGESDPVESDRVCFDIQREVGMAEGARTQFTQGATWYVRGADNQVYVLPRGEANTLYGRRAEFTSCDLDHPHYSFQAQALKMVEGRLMVARDVTLQFEDVPVFWLPWMVQSLKRDRRSGLLMPQFGMNDIVRNNAGYNRHLSNLGFYWAIGDHASARSTFEWYAGNWTAVEGALTYYWRRQFLRGNLRAKHFWRQQLGAPAGREFTLNTSNSWQPDERTRLQLTANFASSTDFVRDNSFDPNELNRSIRSSASANRSFDWGSMTLGADRRQQITTGQVDMTLPSLRLSLSPVTLYSGEAFSVTWNGSGNATRQTRDVREQSLPRVRDSESFRSGVSQSLSAGPFSVSGSVNYQKETLGGKPAVDAATDPLVARARQLLGSSMGSPPGAPLFPETTERIQWSSSVGYRQNLWIGTSITPSVSVNGSRLRSEETRAWTETLGVGQPDDYIAEPLRVSAGASLTTAIYGFWPGVADFSRIRHKIAPSVRWSYSPTPTTTALQDSVFGARNLREQNRITLSFSQTFEAKVASDDTAAADSVELGQPGEPRRLPQAEKITLLALNTGTPFTYDFVSAREDGRGFMPNNALGQINNSIRSDLVRGLQLSMSHSLFELDEDPGDGTVPPRTFSPYLTRLSASFSIDSSFWLFRVLGLTADDGQAEEEESDTIAADPDPPEGVGAEATSVGGPGGVGSMVPGGGGAGPRAGGGPQQGLGQWRAQLSYSLRRTRPTAAASGVDQDNQLLQATISFEPTEYWSLRWNTAYSFTDGEFANHFLTLSRDLHRWTANFDFIKAQNGNFAMQFRVQLRDNPDLKLDYDQRQRVQPAPGRPASGRRAPTQN